jgi:hypothetical protein
VRAGLGLLGALALSVVSTTPATANDDDDDGGHHGLRAVPFVFVGTAEECGTAGSRIVTSAWLGGMGLPDNGGSNTTALDLASNPNKRDPHYGLLLNKNGPTADCSSSGVRILGVQGMYVDALFTLGFDYRNGGHCSGGAPRFNVVAKPPLGPETFHFIGGCGNSTPTPAPQDPLEWTRVRAMTANPAQAFPPIPPGSRIRSITLIHDEGTDAISLPHEPGGVGLAVVDNIYINGKKIRRGTGVMPHPRDDDDGDCDNDGMKDEDDEDDDNDGTHDEWDADDDNDGIDDVDAVLSLQDIGAILMKFVH